ncbi:ATPase [Blastopirellula marina]|uniref:ATPase n=2 Tax=Blastopirellula marina TaxID=124 RepID=A0A2S8FNA1_9BACT|nr:ATPase [Blastopirellula marina]PTL43460.1 ATPase [Blastopirellula marina]
MFFRLGCMDRIAMVWGRVAAFGLFLGLVLPNPNMLLAQEIGAEELTARFDRIEQSLAGLMQEQQQNQSATNNVAQIEEVVAKYLEEEKEQKAASRPTVTVFGRMHLEGLFFPEDSPGVDYFENPLTGDDVEDRIQFRRIRLGAQGKISPTGIYRVELDFGNPETPTFRDTYLGFEELPVLQTLLIGNQKRPLGLDAWNSNTNIIFMERPLPITAFNPNFRRIGIQSYGHTESENVNWQFGMFESSDVKSVGRYLGDDLQLCYVGRVASTPWYDQTSGGRGYFHVGVANMYSSADGDANSISAHQNQARFQTRPELRTSSQWLDTGTLSGATGYDTLGLETVLNIGTWQFTGEYLDTWVNRQADSNLFFDGGYVQAACFLTGEHEPWDRKTGRLSRVKPFEPFFLVNDWRGGVASGLGAWQIAARYSYLSLSDKDIHGGREQNVAVALNWYWTAHSKVLLDVVHGRISDHYPVGGYTGGHFTGLGVRFMMDF